ncbi:MAG TPA: hypothetical protein VK151_08800 [Fluviicola sp.]|nr:hypothetical protein [Fluviicola sp.]
MKQRRLVIGIFISIWIIILAWFIWRESREANALNGPTKQTFGILTNIKGRTFKHRKRAIVSYTVSGKEYQVTAPGDYLDMSVGDTVLIEYASEDHSVARVVNKYYMHK